MTSSVCLNMIVRDEAPVLRRCLRSVRPFVDAWVIVDTGSTDTTREIVREELYGLPGELHERSWVDFGVNRSEAIRLAGRRSDYLYFIDADEELTLPPGWIRPPLTLDSYGIRYLHGPITYQRPSLVASRLPWRFVGPLHEYLECGQTPQSAPLVGPEVIYRAEGARSRDPLKFRHDAEVLERALADDPENARHRFYLAQSLRDAGDPQAAWRQYRRRAEMGGWAEEVYVSLLSAARQLEALAGAPADVARTLLEAHNARPHRAEALVELARFHRERKEWPAAYLFARSALDAHPGDDVLFVETAAHGWRALDEFSIAAFWTGRHDESRVACERLLASPALPADQRSRVIENLAHAVRATGPASESSST